MYYQQATFTFFDKKKLLNQSQISPCAYHQLLLPNEEITITDNRGQHWVTLPKHHSLLVYPLVNYRISRIVEADVLSINSFFIGGRLSASSFFCSINDMITDSNFAMLIIGEQTTRHITTTIQKITNDYKLEYMIAVLEVLQNLSVATDLKKIVDLTCNKKHRIFFNQINEFIENNIFSAVKIKEVAKFVCLSEALFNLRFKEIFGTSFHHYFLIKKIEKSCELIQYSGESIKEIAYSLGFNSPSHFIATFKQIKKITPGQYQKLFQSI